MLPYLWRRVCIFVNTLVHMAACESEGGGALPVMAYKGYLFHASCIWKVGISRVEVNENERVGKSELWSYCFNLLNAAWKWQENLLFGGCTKGVPFLSKMVYKGKGSGLRAEHN